ncbi:MAG TPA: DNA repair protein RecN [Lautropia sp.]|nr:DNA repair protein RecN [Lautropia sp.]
MLRLLRLKDFVIVDAAEIEFGAGFTALTGETGAGKSILLDALGLAIGARGDAAMVREGAARADISAEFAIEPPLEQWLQERELGGDPGVLLVRRILEADGRSRAQINGHATTVALLREVGELLVDIHGQHESQILMRPGAQRELLDRFGKLEQQVSGVASAYAHWQQADKALRLAQSGSREIEIRAERLRWELDEIEQLRLAEGEWEELSNEQKRLAHAKDLIEGADAASMALSKGDGAITETLASLQHRLRGLSAIDAALAPVAELIDSASIQLDEAGSELAGYVQRMDLDPERLAEVENRVSAVFATARKLKLPPERLFEHQEQLRAEHAQLARAQDLEVLEAAVAAADAAYREQAASLSAARRKVAAKLAKGVTEQIGRLGMAKATLLVACEPAPPGPGGSDLVEFRIAAHPGATPRPVAKVASGGELSRLGLAITVLAAQANPVPTLIFDEADAGIGGAVAAVVGELMQRLAGDCQVFCVTHLPQVASRADHHLKVRKTSRASKRAGADVVSSQVDALSDEERLEEIARMLGGRDITDTTRAHAREMIDAGRRTPLRRVQAAR